ncbi:hypothetical protein ACFWNQ_24565 [Streptomyces virginiae]|uniref:hypothetical protein n=1 Tax=Streptomyces virginiae TaxID=1961 RepID=UPI00366852FB
MEHSGSLSHHLETEGALWQLREYAALRSLHQLKEADPHAWVIPRFTGPGHAQLFADPWSPPVVLAWTTRRRRCSRPST